MFRALPRPLVLLLLLLLRAAGCTAIGRTSGAAPPPNACVAAVAEACGTPLDLPIAPPTACSACAQQHDAQLKQAGCTAAAIASACSIAQLQVPIDGLQCDGDHAVWVLYPQDGQRHPLVSFAHGYTAWNVTTWFPQLLYGLAARGYVVVATEAGTAGCGVESSDQARALEWALGSTDLAAHIDRSAGTAVVGHSMGGGATIGSASNATAIKDYAIKVAVAQHPATSPTPFKSPLVPILFMTGDADTVVDPNSVKAQYDRAKHVEKTFVKNHANTHIDACGWSFLPTGCPQGGRLGRYCSGPNNEDVPTPANNLFKLPF